MMGMRSGLVVFEPDGGLEGRRPVPLSLVRVWSRVKIAPAAGGGMVVEHARTATTG